MMGFAFVEPDLGTALQFGIQNQSIMNRVRSTRPTSRRALPDMPEVFIAQCIVFEQICLRGRQAQQRVLLPIS